VGRRTRCALDGTLEGKVKPLAIWFVPHGEGLAHPVDTVSPEREGHSVDPPDLPRQDVESVRRCVRMESRH
jgi:hypothetical protein